VSKTSLSLILLKRYASISTNNMYYSRNLIRHAICTTLHHLRHTLCLLQGARYPSKKNLAPGPAASWRVNVPDFETCVLVRKFSTKCVKICAACHNTAKDCATYMSHQASSLLPKSEVTSATLPRDRIYMARHTTCQSTPQIWPAGHIVMH
jgi:hypothetical protein